MRGFFIAQNKYIHFVDILYTFSISYPHQNKKGKKMNHNNIDVIKDLDAGIYSDKVSLAITEAAQAAVFTGKAAKVVLELSFKRYGDTRQCELTHTIKTTTPHQTGKSTDEDTKATSVFFHTDKTVSVFQEEQKTFDFAQPKTTEE